MDKTLVLLAAGMGSRYGGLKQLDALGPGGATLMDYSVYDALRAGFTRVVFIIRREMEMEFKQVIGARYAGHVALEYAFQELTDLPDGFVPPAERTKPWGTAHALYAARHVVDTPMAVINADDFYGRDSFRSLGCYLDQQSAAGGLYGAMCGFKVANTLSENGTVSRGVCAVSGGNLAGVVEHTRILRDAAGRIVSQFEDGTEAVLAPDTLVSMNFWGFSPAIFPELEALLRKFLADRGSELKSEFYVPSVADALIQAHRMTVKMLTSDASWFGVTYREDRPGTMAALRRMTEQGEYPEKLF
ncbi:hypothetical protein SDC9_134800 [bioreactor metagenome]|uniref:Nucleotidyl transferase domain-containing protein n=1 Tax=bioreactor metagenome TaxID=1076179 RepID=A0A645DDY4_9ZZZZ